MNREHTALLRNFYGNEADKQIKAFGGLFERHGFAEKPAGVPRLFSIPGRTELGGNHTDHNRGCVLAGSIQLDTICVVTPLEEPLARIDSAGFPPVEVDLRQLDPVPSEEGDTSSLVRGIAAAIIKENGKIGGFHATTSSRVLKASGLSSSAAIEIAVGCFFNALYNENRFSGVDLAKFGQWAENRYFGKPCGLMDQLGCALGGISAIDFFDPDQPLITPIPFSFQKSGYALCIVATGGDHADLTPDYAAIPSEMKQAAALLGGDLCRDCSKEDLLRETVRMRKELGDRAWLRALHFFDENERVAAMLAALKENRIEEYVDLVNRSGYSSLALLQNNFSPRRPDRQDIVVALTLTKEFFKNSTAGKGACRVHGGGFAGAIQAYVPVEYFDTYAGYMERFLGKGCVIPLSIRNRPAGEIGTEMSG